MRRSVLCLAILAIPAACHPSSKGDAVREAYDNRAEAVDAAAAAQPTVTAKTIYRARADALREEGRDREKGLEGRSPSSGQGDASGSQPAGQ